MNGRGKLTSTKEFLYGIYRIRSKEEAERRTLLGILESLPYAAGGMFIRNVENTGLFYYTVKTGVFDNFPSLYTLKRHTLLEKVMKTGNIHFVNSFSDVNPEEGSFLSFLPYLDMGYKLAIIPIRATKNPIAPLTPPGLVVIARKDRPFEEKDRDYLQEVTEENRNLLFFYLAALACEKRKAVIKVSQDMLRRSLGQSNRPLSYLMQEYLKDVVSIIDSAEKASLLVSTPIGMKFLAVYGYDAEKLIKLPPIPYEETLRWYHMPERDLLMGKPRIITEKEISVLGKISVISEAEKDTKSIKANLAIPVIVDGKLVMLLNLDNLSTPIAFDDVDIMLATTMSTYLASSHELIVRQNTINRHELLLAQINLVAETLSDERYQAELLRKTPTVDKSTLYKQFTGILKHVLRSFHPKVIKFAMTEDLNENVILSQLEDIPSHIKDDAIEAVQESLYKSFYLKSSGTYHILVIHKAIFYGNDRYHFFVIAIKENDVWRQSDIRYILSAVASATLFAKNLKYLSDIKSMQKETMLMLGKALEFRDMETKGHVERTAYYSQRMAEYIGFKDIEGLTWGAYLHDIGKIAIPDAILLKPGRLTKEEFEVMKRHVIYGYELARSIKGIPETTLNVILYHHEKWDGTGYMKGLKGLEIPVEARIFAVIDVFDALVSPRPYKQPWPVDKALNLLEREAGRHFDKDIVDVFIDLVKGGMLKEFEEIYHIPATAI